jgi:hypothetical protein
MKNVMMALFWLLASGFALGCGGDGTTDAAGGAAGSGGEDGDATSDAFSEAGDAETADGPWECADVHTAIHPASGYIDDCGLLRCKIGVGCHSVKGCSTNDDCVSSTAEAGWQVDYPVYCDQLGFCSWVE